MEGFKNTTRTKYMTGGQVVPPSRPTPPARTKSGPMPTGPAFEGKPDTRPTQGRPVVKPTPPAPARTKSGPMTGPDPKPRPVRRPVPTPVGLTRPAPTPSTPPPHPDRPMYVETKMAKGGMMKEGVSPAKKPVPKAVPAHSDKPMIRRKCGGLAAMPNGKKR